MQLSHGEQRALEVGLALATRPKLVLLDEPMAGMGPEESQHMIALIARIRAQVTVLLVEHDMDAVFRLADRISVMVNGRLIATDAPNEIRDRTPKCERPIWGTSLLLKVENLETAYGASQVLFGLSLDIVPGEMVTLLGRNGMGKTTTVRSIMGLTRSLKGSIGFRGERIERAAARPHRAPGHRAGARGPADLSEPERARAPGRLRRQPLRAQRPVDASSGCSSCFRALRSAQKIRATSSPAASSRCSPSAERS